MPSLAELTDREPQPAFSEFNTNVGSRVDDILNKLIGVNGQQRYQLWPEKVIRGGLTAAGDALAGNVTQWAVDKDTGEVHTSPQMIEKAQEISALAGTGGLAGADATLGSTAFLRPALKYKDKLYKGKEGQQHLDVIPKELYPEFEKMAMSGEDLTHYNFGFMNHKGQFLDREKALEYAISEGLLSSHDANYGALTSTMKINTPSQADLDKAALLLTPYQLRAYKDIVAGKQKLTSTMLADSSKPGTAIEAMGKTGGVDPIHFKSVNAAKFRLGQLQRDKAATKKAGEDIDSSDYMFYNTQIRALKNFINKE